MKLSEAILLSIGVVKNDKDYYLRTEDGQPCGCAIGTALYSRGVTNGSFKPTTYHAWNDKMIELWPWLTPGVCAEISKRHYLGQSRESIAAWIATIEPQDVVTEVAEKESTQCYHEEPV